MPRRPARRRRRTSSLDGAGLLPERVAHELDLLDDRRLDRASISCALRDWQRFAELSPRALRQPYDDLIDYIGPGARRDIEDAIRQLPPRPARELVSLVEPWDELYRSKTAHNPLADESRSWWLRRWND